MDAEGRNGAGVEPLQREPAPERTAPAPAQEQPGAGAQEASPGLRERVRLGVRANLILGAVLLTLGAGLGVWWLALEDELAVAPSRIGSGSTVAAVPMQGTSPAYEESVQEGEAARKAKAQEEGTSHIDALYTGQELRDAQGRSPLAPSEEPPSARIQAPQGTPAEEDDPMLDEKYSEPTPRGTALVQSEAPPQGVAIDAMLEELIAAWSAVPQMTVVRYEEGKSDEPPPPPGDGEEAPAPPGKVVVPAGRMVYAATTVGVDSELPLPVLVEVLERPLVGALLRGEFQQVRDRMLVRFTRLSDERRGLDVAVNAYAVGLECECGAVDGEVDRHWFSRVILPAAFGFAQEYLAAAAQPQVTVSVDGQVVSQQYESGGRERVARGLAGALGQSGEVVFESLPNRSTVRLPRGTEFAVVFVDAVEEAEG